jgi:hypothetical protein
MGTCTTMPRTSHIKVPTLRGSAQHDVAAEANYTIRGKVWLYQEDGGWHFVTLSARQSSVIRALFGSKARPFGSIRISVTIGTSQWRTSLFPEKRSRSYMFAIKAEVRRREHINAGDTIVAEIQVL